MKKRLRLLLVVSAGLLGLALATPALTAYQPEMFAARSSSKLGQAPTAYQPSLLVQQTSYKVGASTGVGFLIFARPTDDATARISIYSPAGYTNNLAQTPGTAIGKAYAIVRAGALAGSDLELSGDVVVGNPADPALQAASVRCRGSATNQAIWVLNTSLQGQSLQVPAFVNVVGQYVVQDICLLPPAAAPFQAQLWLADYTINGVFSNAPTSNSYQWAGDFTPYVGTTPNVAGTVEYRTFVGLPSSLTFKRAKSKSSQVAFSGALKIAGLNTGGIQLHLYSSTKPQPAPNFTKPSRFGVDGKTNGKSAKTKSLKGSGKYSISRKKPKKKTFFQMRFEDYALNGGCQGPSPTGLPIPCLEEAISPMTSSAVAVAPRKKKH